MQTLTTKLYIFVNVRLLAYFSLPSQTFLILSFARTKKNILKALKQCMVEESDGTVQRART